MLTEYIQAAMRKAKYEKLEEDEGSFATIPGFKGLWASAPSRREARKELRSVLEDWILVSLNHRIRMPTVNGLNINLGRVARPFEPR